MLNTAAPLIINKIHKLHVPVPLINANTGVPIGEPIEVQWISDAALVAELSGLMHDIGKAGIRFQEKLRGSLGKGSKKKADKIRHEWLSQLMYDNWKHLNKKRIGTDAILSINASWTSLDLDEGVRLVENNKAISTAAQAVDFCVLSHHGVLGPEGGQKALSIPDSSKHVRKDLHKDQPDSLFDAPYNGNSFSELIDKKLHRLTNLLEERHAAGMSADYWRGISFISRAALIMADQRVSGIKQTKLLSKSSTQTMANTYAAPGKGEASRKLNQTLNWHLDKVSEEAANWALYITRGQDLTGISSVGKTKIDRFAGAGRFEWQDHAVMCLRSLDNKVPTLVLNLASTGTGKTRANIRMASALCADNEPLRFSVALNLRSLTLQTHQALQEQIGLSASEVACLIGDKYIKRYHTTMQRDEHDYGMDYETDVYGVVPKMPEWLLEMTTDQESGEQDHNSQMLIGTPGLVSTIDYLIKGGDLGHQAHHIKALLRLSQSTLILDEIDSYEPKALVAVARVVMMSALFGQHVIASSATLSVPVAEALERAYAAGARMYAALHQKLGGQLTHRVVMVDSMLEPLVMKEGEFNVQYASRVEEIMHSTRREPVYRKALIKEMNSSSSADMILSETVLAGCDELHDHQRWVHPSGKHISLGLVRVASVRNSIALAKHLNEQPGIIATSYHAADIKGRRAEKEARLDHILNRKEGNTNILADIEMTKLIESSEFDEVMFVVVATPVEEIGRDHDFDWAVIEPSSAQSLVQVAGRVNRHRLVPVAGPNIIILDRNYRSLQSASGACFTRPGNETGMIYPTHQMLALLTEYRAGTVNIRSELVAMVQYNEVFPLTAALRFGCAGYKTAFAQLDDNSIRYDLDAGMEELESSEDRPLALLTQSHYVKYKLRGSRGSRHRVHRNDRGEWVIERYEKTPLSAKGKGEWVACQHYDVSGSGSSEAWLAPSLSQVLERHGEEGMEFDVSSSLVSDESSRASHFCSVFGGY